MKKFYTITFIIITTSIYFVFFYDNHHDSNKATVKHEAKDFSATKVKDLEESNLTKIIKSEKKQNDGVELELLKKTIEDKSPKLLTEESFVDADSFTNSFVLENDIVSKEALRTFFTVKNVDEFISKVKDIAPTEQSEAREYQLTQNLKVFKNTNYYAESYACAGKICAISFNYDDLNEDELTKFSYFSKNYTFTNTTVNEHGEKKFKAIYIATDDPSQLQVR